MRNLFIVQGDFLERIEKSVRRLGWAIGVVSEGTRYADGWPVFEQQVPSKDGTPNRPLIGGVAQYLSGLVTEHTGLRCRSEKPGLIGRSAIPYVSPRDRADAELVGREGVKALLRGETDQMVSLLPLNGSLESECKMVSFAEATLGNRPLPPDWLSSDALGVNAGCRSYMQEIVGELKFYPVLE